MIGPICDGFRCGQRVRVCDPAHAWHGRYGFITLIEDRAGYVFRVDLARRTQPHTKSFRAAQLRAVRPKKVRKQ